MEKQKSLSAISQIKDIDVAVYNRSYDLKTRRDSKLIFANEDKSVKSIRLELPETEVAEVA